MKEMYNAPVAEPMLFEAMEKLATGENKVNITTLIP